MRLLVTLLIAVILAGCSESVADEEPSLQLEATEDTGVIRCLVIDDTITPIADALVSVQGGPSMSTTAEGLCGFDGLVPGTYMVTASAPGFDAASVAAEVVAGIDRPTMLRIMLERIFVPDPFVVPSHFDGLLVCSVTATLDFSACSFPQFIYDTVGYDPYDDRQIFFQEVPVDASWVQSEMVWESTQPVGSHMSLALDARLKDGSSWWNVDNPRGESPLVALADEARSEKEGYGNATDVMMRIFSSDLPESRLPDPCVPQPVLGYCFLGIGATVDQEVDIFLHTFHYTTPPTSWTFVADGSP